MEAQAQLVTTDDEKTQLISLDDIREILLSHMPASERLKLFEQRLCSDKGFEERTKGIRSDITSLGLRPT